MDVVVRDIPSGVNNFSEGLFYARQSRRLRGACYVYLFKNFETNSWGLGNIPSNDLTYFIN